MILRTLSLCFFAAVAGKTKHKAAPTGLSQQYVQCIEFILATQAKISEFCVPLLSSVCDCQNVTLTGSRVHTTRMGTFVFVPDVVHDGHAVYINDHHEYLYFYAPIWLVGNDYTKNMAGVRSNGNGLCPTNVAGWEHYVDSHWTEIPLEVKCVRGLCSFSMLCMAVLLSRAIPFVTATTLCRT